MNYKIIKKRKKYIDLGKKCNFQHTEIFVIGCYCELDSYEQGINIGFTVSKKNGNAVKRNKIKRILKHAVNEVLKEVRRDSSKVINIIIIAKPKILSVNYIDLLKELRKYILNSEYIC